MTLRRHKFIGNLGKVSWKINSTFQIIKSLHVPLVDWYCLGSGSAFLHVAPPHQQRLSAFWRQCLTLLDVSHQVKAHIQGDSSDPVAVVVPNTQTSSARLLPQCCGWLPQTLVCLSLQANRVKPAGQFQQTRNCKTLLYSEMVLINFNRFQLTICYKLDIRLLLK